MATSLFKMPFDPERLKVQRIYQSPELSHCQVETMTCPKIQEIYGDLKFLELHEDRPCTYTSLVTSIDGRIAFTDAPQGPLIAKKNKYDPAGADTDWFILNMLRAVSDGVMLGAGTMNAEADYTCHVFDQDMEDMRIANGKNPVPWNIVTSLDATDIPFDHILFRSPEVPVMISTSRKGAALVKENLKNDAYFVDAPTLEDVTEELIQGMKENADKVLVIGTGDLSELALGWATYNGDHMSMYGVNASIPKTLVRHLVRYVADHSEPRLQGALLDVLDTPVSPELLPPKGGEIAQKTEELVGPYELHDFFLYYMLRFGFAPGKIYRMACRAFAGEYGAPTVKKWLSTFYRRFFTQQFKRSCLPDGPKVGSVTLSPRGDWRMPSDASWRLWEQELQSL